MTSSFDEDKTVIAKISSDDLSKAVQKEHSDPCLVQYSGDDLGKRYILSREETKIGRLADHLIQLNDASVSRNHALITKYGDNVFLEDLGSSNGTYVNDKKIEKNQKSELQDQDMIRLGNVVLKFFSGENIDGFIQDKIYKLATIDPGTQIFNKRYLFEVLDTQARMSRKNAQEFCIIYFDLDHFKKVNDNFGHNNGDILLKELAALVKSEVRKDDVFARYGGEEFVVVLPKTNLITTYDLAERLRKVIEAKDFIFKIEKDGKKESITHKQTISIGLAQFSADMENSKTILEIADQKLYHSKKNGRNQTTK